MHQLLKSIFSLGSSPSESSGGVLVGQEKPSSPVISTAVIEGVLPEVPFDRKSDRAFPKGSMMDTRIGGSIINSTKQQLFQNDEILRVILRPEEFTLKYEDPRGEKFLPVDVGQLPDNRHVIQQIGWRGCVQTCVEMLKMDHQIEPDLPALKSATFSSSISAVNNLERAGLQATVKHVRFDDLPFSEDSKPLAALVILKSALKTSGSLIVSLYTEISDHAMILDNIDDRNGTASIRDPFHGWAIEISTDALLKRFGLGFDYIEVQKAGPS